MMMIMIIIMMRRRRRKRRKKSRRMMMTVMMMMKLMACSYLTIILQNRAEYRLILSRQGRRPSWLKSGDMPQD